VGEREPAAGFFGVLALGLGLCCGLPVLASLGVLGAAAGLGIGSWFLIATGLAVAGVGVGRWRRRSRRRDETAPVIFRSEERADDRTV
jgi:hypothetical protein